MSSLHLTDDELYIIGYVLKKYRLGLDDETRETSLVNDIIPRLDREWEKRTSKKEDNTHSGSEDDWNGKRKDLKEELADWRDD